MHYPLNNLEKERLKKGISAIMSLPFVDDLEDYLWEAVFAYTKEVTLIDPFTTIRSKRLFDVVDTENRIGWSAKALQWPITTIPCEFELVIQRADIFKKAELLGFPPLTKESDPQQLGAALLKHWYVEKVEKDALLQGVDDGRVCILVKARNRQKFAYLEEDVADYRADELAWRWTDESKTGLQGVRRSDGFIAFRWYPNQKQLFERFRLTDSAFIFELQPQRLPLAETIDYISERLNRL